MNIPFKLEYQIENKSTHPITVRYRGGMDVIIDGTNERDYTGEQSILVRLPCWLLTKVKFSPERAITKLDKQILTALKEQHDKRKEETNPHVRNIPMDFYCRVVLGVNCIERNGAIHSELLAITLYCGKENMDKPALYSIEDILTTNMDNDLCGTPVEVNNKAQWCVTVNDPDNEIDQWYINIAGMATGIVKETNTTISPGLYMGIVNGDFPPQSLFYTFEELKDRKGLLESLGVFTSKSEASKGGNTDRYLRAEEEVKKLKGDVSWRDKELTKKDAEIEGLKIFNRKLEISNTRLNNDTTSFKQEMKMKETIAKANLDLLKNRQSSGGFVDFCKGMSILAGLAVTGVKLFGG